MTLERYFSLLTKQWGLIISCIVVVGLGTYIGSRLVTPIYQSTVLVRVAIHTISSNTTDYNGLLASDQLVQTEALLATSNPVLHDVVTRYPGLTVDQLARMTSTAPRLNTQVFEIDVQDSSPDRAASLANDIAATLIRQQVEENQQDNRRSQQQLQLEVDTTHQRIDAIQAKITALQLRIASLQSQKGTQIQVMGLQAQAVGLQNQLNALQDHYTQWQTTLLQLETVETQNSNFLLIAQPAQSPRDPIRPQLLLNTAAGTVAGLLLGLLLALLFERLDTRVRTPEDLLRLLDWPILGVIWRGNNAKGKQEDPMNLNINFNNRRVNVEPYRILRTNIGFLAVNKPIRMLMVTSALPGEGKSTIASNLAIFMAKAGKSTLLIDADLRQPSLQRKFHLVSDKKGLSNSIIAVAHALSTGIERERLRELEHAVLQRNISTTEIPNLYIMTAGSLPPNPPEMLESKAFDILLTMIADSGIDQVIFDTAPLIGLSDTSILMSKADGVLLVVDITQAKSKMLKQMKEILTRTHANVLGCVVNKQHSKRRDIPYYYYQAGEEEQKSENERRPIFVVSSNPSSEQESGSSR